MMTRFWEWLARHHPDIYLTALTLCGVQIPKD